MLCAKALHSSIIKPQYLRQTLCDGIATYSIMPGQGLLPLIYY